MPVIVPKNLPAVDILIKENIFIMNEARAMHQDIRSLKIAILNLMPKKIETETQLLSLIANSPIQVDITLLHPKSYQSKNTSEEHLLTFYKTFDEVKNQKFDGMIITGAPIELMKFEDVDYWDELKEIMEYTKTNVTSTVHICWGAQAGLYYHHKIPKYELKEKMFGVFSHTITLKKTQLLRGFDDEFYVPHSRHTEVLREDVEKVSELDILTESEDAGVYIVATKDRRQIFITGHSEYEPYSLKNEYDRDINKGMDIAIPKNYYKNDDPSNEPVVKWRGHANLLFKNWINYVYQETPYNIEDIV